MNLTILQGDALEKLRELPGESAQCCITSPPYWMLRDYGTATWEGGDAGCDHKPSGEWYLKNFNAKGGLSGGFENQASSATGRFYKKGRECPKCGAKRIDAQIGLEETPEAYVAKIVEVFREVRRVLKNDGTLWLNLGDSYAAGKKGNDSFGDLSSTLNNGGNGTKTGEKMRSCQRKPPPGLKPKDLCGIPWRVALALQAGFSECTGCELNMRSDLWPIRNGHRICMDCLIERRKSKVIQSEEGWYLRSDIIWHKPNPMPESVTDRPTKAHEYLFLLSKSRRYYYDADAIREPTYSENRKGFRGEDDGPSHYVNQPMSPGNSERFVKPTGKWSTEGEQSCGRRMGESVARARANGADHDNPFSGPRNKRSVWTVPTAPYSEAHFATFPPDLIKPCILAGSRPGDTVFDPFGGSGTTGMVAIELGRKAILIELNPEYVKLAERRCDVTPGLPLC